MNETNDRDIFDMPPSIALILHIYLSGLISIVNLTRFIIIIEHILCVSMHVFPERLNEKGRTTLIFGWCHPVAEASDLIKKKNEESTSVHCSLFLDNRCNMMTCLPLLLPLYYQKDRLCSWTLARMPREIWEVKA